MQSVNKENIHKEQSNKEQIKSGIQSGISIALGYIPIAMAFGIIAKAGGTTLGECVGFSAIVFAGASQFLALDMISSGASVISIMMTMLIFNFRHFIMSASISTKLEASAKKWRPLMAFWVTDETYSVAYLKQDKISAYFYVPMAGIAYLSFSFGSFLGYTLGSVMPTQLNNSMGIALYSMFLAILTPEFQKSIKTLKIFLTAGILNVFARKVSFIPQGWHIILVIGITILIWDLVDKRNDTDCEVKGNE